MIVRGEDKLLESRRQVIKRSVLYAAPKTMPVLIGFIVLGIAYGILMTTHGLGIKWSLAMSAIAYCGSMQYVAIGLLAAAFNPWYTLFLTLMVNARHLFYGLSMLERFKGLGRWKLLVIFLLTDETFSILCGPEPPEDIDKGVYSFAVAFLNYSYWFIGTAIGAVMGGMLIIDTTGMDFVLTAMFVVIFTEQWITQFNHKPAVIGVACSVLALLIFGSSVFMVPAMALILLVMTLFRKTVDEEANL